MSVILEVSMRDALSGPARAAASSMRTLKSEVHGASAALEGLEKKQDKVARALERSAARAASSEARQAARREQKVGRSMRFAEVESALAARTHKVASHGDPISVRREMKKKQLANVAAARGAAMVARKASMTSAGGAVASRAPGAVGGVASAASGASGGLGSMLAGGAAVAGIAAVAGAVGMLTIKMAELTASAGRWLVATQLQREASLLSFRLMFGGVENASAAYKKAIALSMQLGMSTADTVHTFQALGAQGIKVNDIETMVKSLADLKLVAPNIQADRAISAIGQIMSKGKLGLEELQGQLGDSANLNVGYVKDALGEILNVRGKTEAEIRSKVDALISAGKVDSATGIKAVQKAISRMAGGGEAGVAATAASKSLGGILSQLSNLPANLALSMDLPGTGPIKEFGQAILNVMKVDGPVAKALQDSVGGLFESATKILFGDMPGESGITKFVLGVADALDTIDTVINNVAPIAKAFLSGMGEGFSEVWNVLSPVAKELGEIFGASFESKGEAIAAVAKLVGKGFAYMVVGVGAVVAVIGVLSSIIPAVIGALGYASLALVAIVTGGIGSAITSIAEFATKAYDAGMSIVEGVASGITAGLAAVAAAAASIGSTAVSAVESALIIHSPSRVMAELGAHTAMGFAVGVNDNAGPVDAAMTSLVAPPAGAAGGAAAASGSMGNVTININIDGSGKDAKEIGDHVAKILPAALRDALDQVAVEMGLTG